MADTGATMHKGLAQAAPAPGGQARLDATALLLCLSPTCLACLRLFPSQAGRGFPRGRRLFPSQSVFCGLTLAFGTTMTVGGPCFLLIPGGMVASPCFLQPVFRP